MMRSAACSLALALCACSAPIPDADVERLVKEYVGAANARDSGKAMSLMMKDSTISSITASKVTKGYDAIRAATERSLSQPQPGRMTLLSMDVMPLGSDAALASGAMSIDSGQFRLGGNMVAQLAGAYSIVVRRTPEGLRVAHEHFSVRVP